MIRRWRGGWVLGVALGVAGLGLADRPASASALRYELLPNSARWAPYWERRSDAAGRTFGEERSFDPVFRIRGYLSEGGQRRDLGDLGGDFVAPSAINRRGQVVGTATGPGETDSMNPRWRPFLWEDGRMIDLAPMYPDLSLGATDINNAGQVVGGQAGIWDGQAFLYDQGTFRLLGTLGGRSSTARWINEEGLIVGRSETTDDRYAEGTPRAMIVADGIMHDLNRLTDNIGNWILPEALGITEDGWIQVIGYPKGGGMAEGFWLRPIAPEPGLPDPIPTPEPASVALWVVLGGAALGLRRRMGR